MADEVDKTVAAAPAANRKKCILITSAVVIVVAVAAALGGYFGTRNKSSSSSSSSSSSGNSSSTATALPLVTGQLIGYYGQNAIANGVDIKNGTNSRVTPVADYQGSLASYCKTGYYNTINLAFLNLFGGGNNHFQITFGSSSVASYGGTYVYSGNGTQSNAAYVVQNFENLGADITTCQSLNVKIVLSLGGDKSSPYTWVTGDGVAYANLFYNVFLEGTAGPVRPFGSGVVLDGIELDIERNDDPTVWNAEMINFITTLRKLSSKTQIAKYKVVPQCYLGLIGKDASVGDVIAATGNLVNYLIVQYYNNPQCSYPFGFNFGNWTTLFPGSIILGLAGDWTSAISGGFLEPGPLQAVYDMVKSNSQFGGISVYDVSSSNPPAYSWNVSDYANPPLSTYSETLRNVLNGQIVGSGYPAQGAQENNLNLRTSCGGTWVYANSNCSLATCDASASTCPTNYQCFSFLEKTC
ncbi:Chitinase 1 [Physocladia obscura]|uniref:Chitinase 1 n=1 Tax=Physocladia obscura TaxID=109957 RepID=A0AAD5T8W1_9FUNG|nr:Chitinase 1 [Physocladia obscura]